MPPPLQELLALGTPQLCLTSVSWQTELGITSSTAQEHYHMDATTRGPTPPGIVYPQDVFTGQHLLPLT